MKVVGNVLKDRYEIIAELGKGGMSTVYLSRDKNLGSYWAIKQVNKKNCVDIEAFKREVELLSSLNHSDVPRIVDKIENDEDFFVVMDFIGGVSLGKKVLSQGPQKEDQVINWAKMLCDVLYYLHTVKNNPIIYRDMKPDNIMLTELGRVKLIDFGIAKECIKGQKQSGTKVGTKGYAAPEQYKGEALDERTDIYSLGVTLYYLVTAKAPGDPPYAVQPIRSINPKLSEGLEYIINKCTQQNPDNRYENCMELKYDLENIDTLNSEYRKTMRNKLIIFSSSLICFLLSIVLVFFSHKGIQKENNENYDYQFNKAQSEIDNHKDLAIEDFKKAIKYNPNKIAAYEWLYKVLLPSDGDKVKTEQAIDIMRESYVDNKNSSMYKDARLLYLLVKSCIEVQDPTYTNYASDSIEKYIKKSSAYKNGDFSVNEIDCYYVIASWNSKDVNSQNFKALNSALLKLEKDTKNSKTLSADNKLNNYYILEKVYCNYPDNLNDAYAKIIDIGEISKKIIDTNRKIKFPFIQQMYESIAESLYDSGNCSNEINTKRNMISKSINWYGYLEDINGDLSELAQITKGDAYRSLFETYNNPEEINTVSSAIVENLNKAASIYNNVLNKNPQSFLAAINLTETYIDLYSVKNTDNMKNTIDTSYSKVLDLKKINNTLDSYTLSQFSTLKQQMKNHGFRGRIIERIFIMVRDSFNSNFFYYIYSIIFQIENFTGYFFLLKN